MTLKLAIEDAIHKAAPDVLAVEADGVARPEPAPGPVLLQLEVSDAVRGPEPAEGWATAGGLPELSGGGLLVKPVSGEPVLFIRLEETVFAYRPDCPGCEGTLEEAELAGAELACGGCGKRYDVRRAGRCLDEPSLYLDPVPLLVDDSGLVRVALGARTAA